MNGLITGGVLVGKICQALGGMGSNTKKYIDEKTGYTVSGAVTFDDVKFFRSDVSGRSVIYAFNASTDSNAEIAVPNSDSDGGVMYVVRPTEKVAFAEAESANVSPLTEVTTGMTSESAEATKDDLPSLFNMTFSNLTIGGGGVNVGSFTLSATTGQLIVVSVVAIGALIFLRLCSDKGVSSTNQNRIQPNGQITLKDSGQIETRYVIDFDSMGLMEHDRLNGLLKFEIQASAEELVKLSKIPSEPLHPAEKEFFSRLESGLL